MSAPENPFAFPMAVPGDCMTQPADGMTLRDWFAGQALAGLLALPDDGTPRSMQGHAEHYAVSAFVYADAMLVERAKGGAA